MGSGDRERRAAGFSAALAGLQAGMLGALVLMAWLASASAWYRRSIWIPANLMASTFYGESALRRGFAFSSLVGLALYVILYSALGAVFASVVQRHAAGVRLVLWAILVGLGWYYLSFGLLWKKLNPLLPLYTHDAPMLAGHLLYGGLLARFPRYLRALGPPAEAPQAEPVSSPVEGD